MRYLLCKFTYFWLYCLKVKLIYSKCVHIINLREIKNFNQKINVHTLLFKADTFTSELSFSEDTLVVLCIND